MFGFGEKPKTDDEFSEKEKEVSDLFSRNKPKTDDEFLDEAMQNTVVEEIPSEGKEVEMEGSVDAANEPTLDEKIVRAGGGGGDSGEGAPDEDVDEYEEDSPEESDNKKEA